MNNSQKVAWNFVKGILECCFITLIVIAFVLDCSTLFYLELGKKWMEFVNKLFP